MAIVVENGTGLTNADSYVSIADADIYLAVHHSSSTWDALDTPAKEIALKKATRYLDHIYGDRWVGKRLKQEMSLDWPRYHAYDEDGWLLDTDAVPQRIKDATAELALRSYSNELISDLTTPGTIKRERSKVGPLEEEIEYAGGRGQQRKYVEVECILKPLLISLDRAYRS